MTETESPVSPGQAFRVALHERWRARGRQVDQRPWDTLPEADRDDLETAAQAAIMASGLKAVAGQRDKLDTELEAVHAALGWEDHQRAGWRLRAGLPISWELANVTMTGARCDAAADIADLTAERDRLARELDEARRERDDAESQTDRANAILTALNGDQNGLRVERDEARRLYAAVTAERDQLRDGGALLGRVVEHQVRSLYGAWIEAAQHRNLTAAVQILNEQLDGFDGPEWNGKETGTGWLERTRDDKVSTASLHEHVEELRASVTTAERLVKAALLDMGADSKTASEWLASHGINEEDL